MQKDMVLQKNTLPSEHVEQRSFVSWFRKTYPNVLIFAIPNGEKRSKTVALRLKAEGVKPGIPDLFIPEWRVWVEMKRQKGGRLSPDQNKIIAYLRSVGYKVLIGYGCEDAKTKIQELAG